MSNKGGFLFFVVFFMLIVATIFLVAADNISTKVNVPASPPFLVKNISNQSWALNTNLTGAFNLNDYFKNFFGKNLTYAYTLPKNITVSISSDGNVSFYPDFGYTGNSTIKFTANDGSLSGESNLVYLKVGVDTESPKWSNISYKPTKVYQNTYVDFNTTWADNMQLSKFIFSIYQGGKWENFSKSFRGILNFSSEKMEISAPEGSIVFWYFCGYDTSNNVNCTTTKNFTVLNHQSSSPPSVTTQPLSSILQSKLHIPAPQFSKVKSFDVSENFFKISLKQGTSKTRVFKISNTGSSSISFNLSVSSLGNFTKFSTKNFSLNSGDSKVITIDFSSGEYVSPGEYFGTIVISSSSSTSDMRIPVIIDVNPYILGFKVNVTIPESYKNINPGKEISVNISIMNLKDVPNSPVKLYYAVKDFSGNIYNYSISNLTLSSSLDVTESLKIPSDANPGNYLFYARVSLENESEIDSDIFQVGTTFNFNAIFKYGSIIFAIFILTVLSMILFFKYRKEHEKKRLLNLYLMVNLLQKLIKEGNTESALNLFIRIKSAYGEKVSESAFENKEKLREEINLLSEKLQKQVEQESSSKKNNVEDPEEKGSQNLKQEKSLEKKEGSSKHDSEKRKFEKSSRAKKFSGKNKRISKSKSKKSKGGKKK